MSRYALLICRSQTEAVGLRRHLTQMGVQGEVTRPPLHAATVSCGRAGRGSAAQTETGRDRLRQVCISPCRVLPDEGAGV